MKQNRRKFFGMIGAGALGTFVAQLFPFRLLAGDDAASARRSKPKVMIHPLAVPRSKRSVK
ncbi:MAG: hypothetical protein WC313_02100 [Candidatus Kapaibacterium sp.]|jgi:hypothetical protein